MFNMEKSIRHNNDMLHFAEGTQLVQLFVLLINNSRKVFAGYETWPPGDVFTRLWPHVHFLVICLFVT